MIRTIEAEIDEHGEVRLIEPLRLRSKHRALVMIIDAEPATATTLACEHSLAEWNLPEEDIAWMHLQDGES